MPRSGLAFGRAVADERDRRKGCRAIVVMQHGLITWGASPKQAYDDTIEMVSRAEEYIRSNAAAGLLREHRTGRGNRPHAV